MIFFIFKAPENGFERVCYEKIIAPFINHMPKSAAVGHRRVCDGRMCAYIGSNLFRKVESSWISCQILSLPGTTHTETLTYLFSKTSRYKCLINWRWVHVHNHMNYIRCCYVIKLIYNFTCEAYWSLQILTSVPKHRCSPVLIRTFCCWS